MAKTPPLARQYSVQHINGVKFASCRSHDPWFAKWSRHSRRCLSLGIVHLLAVIIEEQSWLGLKTKNVGKS